MHDLNAYAHFKVSAGEKILAFVFLKWGTQTTGWMMINYNIKILL